MGGRVNIFISHHIYIYIYPSCTEARKSAVVPGPAILVLSKLVLKGNLKIGHIGQTEKFHPYSDMDDMVGTSPLEPTGLCEFRYGCHLEKTIF